MFFRATKDIDMVLIVEALTPEFVKRFGIIFGKRSINIKIKAQGNHSFIGLLILKMKSILP